MPKTYTTVSGDIWDKIAYSQLGGERYTSVLMEANPAYIDTVIFSAGVVLTLPEITTPIPKTLPPWKR
jgi:phage tail protein X